jgi:retron-type reverse transcriptase
MALIEIVDNILSDLENGKYISGIYLDLSKAFDTVDHKILLYKLNHYGIRDHSLKWFESYLSDRTQFTYINNNQSNLKPMKYGVPQGSVLGPLLFLIYTNDIVNSTSQDCKTRLFADDTNGFVTADSPAQLKHLISSFLEDIFSWCSENKLTVNLDKTCYTICYQLISKIHVYKI